MTASEKTAEGPDLPNTSMTTTRCCVLSGAGKANTSEMSAAGSASARGPEKWSDMLNVSSNSRVWAGLALDGSKAGRHHETIALLHQVRGLVCQLQIVQPFRVRHHCGASADSIRGILEGPEMHDGVQIAAFCVQVSKRRSKMTDLRRQAVLGIEIKLLREFSRFDLISADVDEHGDPP